MGLVACPDLSEIRGLVLSVFRAVTISVAQGCTKKICRWHKFSAFKTMMSSQQGNEYFVGLIMG
jgi:hypothetical protein